MAEQSPQQSIDPPLPADAPELPQLPQHRFVWILLIAVIIALFGAALVRRLNGEAQKLPVLWQVHDFQLVDQNNKAITNNDLFGRVWVAGFIFTRCAGTCITITNGMDSLNKKLADAPGIQLVSFSMDPEFDTPEILDRYAKFHGIDSARWRFATDPLHKKDTIQKLTVEDFKLALQEAGANKDEPIIHSSMLALVDRHGRVRGYYSGIIPADVTRAANDAKALDREMDVRTLPALNAALNSVSTVLLIVGYVLIRRRRIVEHQTMMMTAGVTSAAFLISYVIYHLQVGSVKFQGQGPIRTVYFIILITHVLLAASIAVLVPITFWRAFQGNFVKHRRIARITFPIWLYVSITGVIVYVMLYQMYPH